MAGGDKMDNWLVFLLLLTQLKLNSAAAAGKEVAIMETMSISSSAFKHGEAIPARYTCDGTDVSPPLAIGKTPDAARTLALIMEDPDAPMGSWVHWVAWDIPAQTREIPENSVPSGVRQGRNSWNRNSYGGPCPPAGTHRYFFRLYALDTELDVSHSATKAELERAMQGHILARGELMGTYRRQ